VSELASSAESSAFELLNPKKRDFSTGIDGFYPYYAGFSAEFARSIALSQNLAPSACVLDPWNGSGTTTFVARQLGLKAIGVDLNPVATLLAEAKLAFRPSFVNVDELAATLIEVAPGVTKLEDDALRPWLTGSAVSLVRSTLERVSSQNRTTRFERALLVVALMRSVREFAVAGKGSNPTWVRPESPKRIAPLQLRKRFAATLRHLVGLLQISPGHPDSAYEVLSADARCLPLSDESVDFCVTSPPYCTRIDYATATSFELAFLNFGERTPGFDELRSSLMGTTKIRRDPRGRSTQPRIVTDLLSMINEHPSYASAGYYLKNFRQYFDDAEASLGQLARVLRRGGAAFLVVQTSFYKEIEVDLPRIYLALGEQHALQCEEIARLPVGRNFSQINPRSRAHLPRRQYFESVLKMTKRQASN
jgi:DNA modification methylase